MCENIYAMNIYMRIFYYFSSTFKVIQTKEIKLNIIPQVNIFFCANKDMSR